MNDKARCCVKVGDAWTRMPCSRRATVERNGLGYCHQHDPEAIAERRAARNRKWEEHWSAERAAMELNTARRKATDGLTIEELRRLTPEMLRQLLEGAK